ncbi:MAG: hypothetical protein JO316_00920 [Abitibacteriaceae bacterium]|nr:hypothetical protein [Abditibacteriaceae bacterium]
MAGTNIKTSLACPQCGTANTRADMTCVHCGEWLPWAGGLSKSKSASPWEEEVKFDEEPQLALILPSFLLPPAGLLLCAYYSLSSPGKAKQTGYSALAGLGVYMIFYFVRAVL